MKKKKLKNLSLKKTSISNLNGGAPSPSPIELSRFIPACATGNLVNCTTTTWISELGTVCCPPTQNFDCDQSFLNPCQLSIDVPCPH